jgi:D-hydroxyproline dehydrogenase subunit alpha
MNERYPQSEHDTVRGEALDPATTLTCRCEEVLVEEIVAAIVAGARSVDDVKRRTRSGMGTCQGVFCVPVIAAMVAQATGVPIERIGPMTARPPVRPLALESLANMSDLASDPNDVSASDDKE